MTTLVDSDNDVVAIHGQPASLHIPILQSNYANCANYAKSNCTLVHCT